MNKNHIVSNNLEKPDKSSSSRRRCITPLPSIHNWTTSPKAANLLYNWLSKDRFRWSRNHSCFFTCKCQFLIHRIVEWIKKPHSMIEFVKVTSTEPNTTNVRLFVLCEFLWIESVPWECCLKCNETLATTQMFGGSWSVSLMGTEGGQLFSGLQRTFSTCEIIHIYNSYYCFSLYMFLLPSILF